MPGQRGSGANTTRKNVRMAHATGSFLDGRSRFTPTVVPPPGIAARWPGDVRPLLDRHDLPCVPGDGCAARRGQDRNPADDQCLSHRVRADEPGAWTAFGCD